MKRIAGIYELEALAKNRKSVVCPCSHAFNKPKPAAFIINLPGATILQLIKNGLFVYKKEEKCQKNS